MGINIPLLNSCCCLSLRTGAIIIGGMQLFVYTLYFVQILISRIRYSILDHIVKFDELLTVFLFEYVDVLNVVFAAILLIGIFKENSSLVAAWLLVGLTRTIDLTWIIFLDFVSHYPLGFIVEELIFLGYELTCLWIGYSYYTTMPKNNIYIL